MNPQTLSKFSKENREEIIRLEGLLRNDAEQHAFLDSMLFNFENGRGLL